VCPSTCCARWQGLRNIAHYFNATLVVSLLQPSPETFALFDSVLLLSEGRIVYHGDPAQVLPFFQSLCLR
jgi:ABC-type multidrug transport system ATPase subunit